MRGRINSIVREKNYQLVARIHYRVFFFPTVGGKLRINLDRGRLACVTEVREGGGNGENEEVDRGVLLDLICVSWGVEDVVGCVEQFVR